MGTPNLQFTVKTVSGKTVIQMQVDGDIPDAFLGYDLRSIFTGGMESSEGDPPAYVVVERI